MKNYIKIFYTAFLLFLIANSFSHEYRNSGFIKPMNVPFNLSGSFGEPRKDHFHSGIDIKTNGVEGEPVFAIGDGYISRIRVSPFGYGKAIYITHTNGFTSVYGHLSTFFGTIEKYIHAQHYLQKKSELDLYVDAKLFPLKKGDTIAFSGNTGGSQAPHLHFEIRNTKTEHALNPLDFYPRSFYVDTIPPQINKVKISRFYKNFYISEDSTYYHKNINNEYLSVDTIKLSNIPNFSLSLEGFDKQDDSRNKNGIKKIEMFQFDTLIFAYDINEVDFNLTRMCNAFIDYEEMMNDSGYFYNCYQLKGNTLPFYSLNTNNFIKIKDKEVINLTILCYDYNENKTTINLIIKREDIEIDVDSVPFLVYPLFSGYYNNKLHINLPKGTFYEVNVIEIDEIQTDKNKVISEKYEISVLRTEFIPLHKPAKIEFNSSIKKNRNKVVVVRQDHKGKETALKTSFDKTKFYADTKELGTFYLKYDTTKPEIKFLNLNPIAIGSEIININISDNLSGIDSYNGYIDGKWVNFYYDAKNDLIQYNFDKYCTKGEHLLKIVVTDKVGNKTSREQKFTY